MPSYPSTWSARESVGGGGTPQSFTRLNTGDGTFTQDTNGTVSAFDPAAGTVSIVSVNADFIQRCRRDVQQVAGFDPTAEMSVVEARVLWTVPPANTAKVQQAILLMNGTADGNISEGFGIYNITNVSMWTCSYNTGSSRSLWVTGAPANCGGFQVTALFSKSTLIQAEIVQLDTAGNAQNALTTTRKLNAAGFASLYIGNAIGEVAASGATTCTSQVGYCLRSPPT